MSSLRLALKKSLEENPANGSSASKNATFDDFVDYEEILRIAKPKRKRTASTDLADGESNNKKRSSLLEDASINPMNVDEAQEELNSTDNEAKNDDNMDDKAEYSDDGYYPDVSEVKVNVKEEVPVLKVNIPSLGIREDNVINTSTSEDKAVCKNAHVDVIKIEAKSDAKIPEPEDNDYATVIATSTVDPHKSSSNDWNNDKMDDNSAIESSECMNDLNLNSDAQAKDEESMDESTSFKKSASKKSSSKRRSGLLRSLGIPEQLSSDNLDELGIAMHDELVPRLSSRAAAVVAKSRIASKATIIIPAHVNTPREDDNGQNTSTSASNPTSFSAAKAKKGSKKSITSNQATVSMIDVAPAEEPDPWACCDRCSKWRKLPLSVDSSTLPEQWYCEMNIWDASHSTCDDAEEVEETATSNNPASDHDINATAGGNDDGPSHMNNESGLKQLGGESGMDYSEAKVHRSLMKPKKGSTANNNAAALTPGSKAGLDATDIYSSSRLAQKRRSSSLTVAPAKERTVSSSTTSSTVAIASSIVIAAAEETINWVECTRCRKWRKAPLSVDVDALPDTWICEQNTWNPAYARCSAKQESESDHIPSVSSIGGGLNFGLTRSTSQTSVGSSNRGSNMASSQGSSAAVTATGAPKKILTQWVCCERCEKWRKIPPSAGVNAKELPEKWYCEYNTWDLERASCEVQEESDNENDAVDAAVVAARSQLILANSKGPGTLSYRRIIYGTDGRIRPIYSDKSKTGHGLFSFTERMISINRHAPNADGETYEEPWKRVSYWASSLYDEAGINYTSSSKAKTTGKDNAAAANNNNVMVSAIKGNPLSKPQIRLEELSRYYGDSNPADSILTHFHPPQAASSSSQPSTSSSMRHCWPKKMLKSSAAVDNATFFEQRALFMSIIRSCFAADEHMSLSLVDLFELIRSAQFLNEHASYYRQRISVDSLKMMLKYMEDLGEVYVTTDSSGMCMIHYSKFEYPVATASSSMIDGMTINQRSGPLLPPKLRAKNIKTDCNSKP